MYQQAKFYMPNDGKIQEIIRQKWWVYIVECSDGTLYTGITKDLAVRLVQHNRGNGAKYTRGRGPVQLVYSEQLESEGLARRREYAIKRLCREEKIRLIGMDKSAEPTT